MYLFHAWLLVRQVEVRQEDRLLGTEDYFIVKPRIVAIAFILKTATITIEANQEFRVIAKYLQEEEVELELDYFKFEQEKIAKIRMKMEQLFLFSQFSFLFWFLNHLLLFQKTIQD